MGSRGSIGRLVALALATAALCLPAGAAQASQGHECDGADVIVVVQKTTCAVGGKVHRAYTRRCAGGDPVRLSCRVRRFRCTFAQSEGQPGVASCKRKRKRVIFAVPGASAEDHGWRRCGIAGQAVRNVMTKRLGCKAGRNVALRFDQGVRDRRCEYPEFRCRIGRYRCRMTEQHLEGGFFKCSRKGGRIAVRFSITG